jgi:ATP-binding cassette subfamily C protein
VTSIQQALQIYVNALPAVHHLNELEASCRAAAEPPQKPGPAIPLRDRIQLDSVTFGYGDGERSVVRDLDLTIAAGTTVAVVGSSGAGKTTIADLIIGLVEPRRGHVSIDNAPLTPGLRERWCHSIGYVPQDPFLFHDTIRANLLWAVPDATESEMKRALAHAAADFVEELPDGLETVVGDRGMRLSGGERQRIALARALLRRPSVLVLDEATSALDSHNEVRIFEAIEQLHGTMTIVIITHRLSTVARADAIHVIEEGRVVQTGSWTSLTAASGGPFRELCRAQGVG